MKLDEQYFPARSKYFEEDYVRLVKKNKGLQERIDKKILQVLKNPNAHKNLKRPLQRYKEAHIDPFVMTFRIEGNVVKFARIEHHDKIFGLPHE